MTAEIPRRNRILYASSLGMSYWDMPKRSSKPSELNELAASLVAEATGKAQPKKNPAAVALGRLGGLKGGPARATKLTKKQRTEIAKKAALARWADHSAR